MIKHLICIFTIYKVCLILAALSCSFLQNMQDNPKHCHSFWSQRILNNWMSWPPFLRDSVFGFSLWIPLVFPVSFVPIILLVHLCCFCHSSVFCSLPVLFWSYLFWCVACVFTPSLCSVSLLVEFAPAFVPVFYSLTPVFLVPQCFALLLDFVLLKSGYLPTGMVFVASCLYLNNRTLLDLSLSAFWVLTP